MLRWNSAWNAYIELSDVDICSSLLWQFSFFMLILYIEDALRASTAAPRFGIFFEERSKRKIEKALKILDETCFKKITKNVSKMVPKS